MFQSSSDTYSEQKKRGSVCKSMSVFNRFSVVIFIENAVKQKYIPVIRYTVESL